jgi:hypothetical protein
MLIALIGTAVDIINGSRAMEDLTYYFYNGYTFLPCSATVRELHRIASYRVSWCRVVLYCMMLGRIASNCLYCIAMNCTDILCLVLTLTARTAPYRTLYSTQEFFHAVLTLLMTYSPYLEHTNADKCTKAPAHTNTVLEQQSGVKTSHNLYRTRHGQYLYKSAKMPVYNRRTYR